MNADRRIKNATIAPELRDQNYEIFSSPHITPEWNIKFKVYEFPIPPQYLNHPLLQWEMGIAKIFVFHGSQWDEIRGLMIDDEVIFYEKYAEYHERKVRELKQIVAAWSKVQAVLEK